MSNTYLLEKNGWNGLCIEPNPVYWYRLASFRTCTVVGAAVGGAEDGREINFTLNGGVNGGIVGDGMDNKNGTPAEKRNLVSIVTVFKETNVPSVVDYFSLDVEGAESIVMEHFPWDLYRFRFMTVERPRRELRGNLTSHGYKMVRMLSRWGETLWINAELVNLSKHEIDVVIGRL